jgi:hypothetical protein
MRTIRWFGSILLAAAGVAAIVVTAGAQSITQTVPGGSGKLGAVQLSQLGTAIGACWTWAASGAQGVQFFRGTVDPSKIFVTVTGQRQLSRPDAALHLLAGGTLLPGRNVAESVTCEVAGAQLTALASLAAAQVTKPDNSTVSVWPGATSTLTTLSFSRVGSDVVLNYALGQQARDVEDAITDSENGQTIIPTGVVE